MTTLTSIPSRVTRPLGLTRIASGETAPLTWLAVSCAVLAAFCLVALSIDRRFLDDAPLWLKPLKFAISNGLFAGTLAWMLRSRSDAFVARVSWGVSVLLGLENVLITIQAARGTRSHFNASTIGDTIVLGTMGIAAVGVLMITCRVAFAFYRDTSRTLAYAGIRWGLALSIFGAALGGAMAVPRSHQLRAFAQQPGSVSLGSHTVGGPTDSPNDRVLYWNRDHGDMRAPHFFGLHAMQLLPLIAWMLSRSRLNQVQARNALRVAGASYAGVIAVLLSQAIRGEAPLRPGIITFSLLLAVGIGALIAYGLTILPRKRAHL